ncbi:MAG: hypothetical protein COU32_03850, partial [Candidatus Magasanikbacteria bacterium CG10_big_fil_rev_8_21_14_0_10_42_10]
MGDKYYGFCTQEKNVWFFPGDTCEPAFASCKAYTNQETRTIVSYLSRTLEYGSCNENAVGCLPYVTEKAVGTDEWVGTKDIQVQNKLAGAQQSMYFNDRISAGNGCPDTEDGCSSFIGAQRNSTTGAYITDATKAYIQDFNRVRNLKKAPNYLGCYDTDFTPTSPEVNYPATPLDLPKLTSDFRCDAYASVCLPEEVGCEAYTPVGGGETIPGVVGGNFCPDACVGYSTFRQEETKFEAGEYPLYFIPTNGTECSAQHAGCDEFTNISDASKGGEKLEYYTYIKQCEEPTGNNSSVYYSWEGSESAGFVLRVHTLAKVGERAQFIPASFQADFVTSSPAYADDSLANLTENDGLCNETLYNNVINKTPDVPRADDDCRALYDTNGTVYYRLLAETVTVSSACHPIRKTESRLVAADQTISTQNTCLQKNGYWDGTSCQLCYGGGSWVPDAVETTKGSCVYYAIDAPGESTSCPAVANECRAYTGNAGNNIKPVFESITDTFDPIGDTADSLIQAKASWTPSSSVNIVAESLQVSFNSLRVDGGVSGDKIYRALPAASIEAGTSYELTFWARGTAQTLSIYLEQGGNQWSLTTDPLTNANLPISISQTWRSYTVGPVTFPGDASSSLRLVFDRTGSPQRGVYFIDNVSLTRTTSNVYLLRDSWKTREGYDAPVACFSSQQNPNGPFPGAALGCAAYTTSLGQKVNATSFERLCREKAVGCAPLWDTFNSNAAYAEVYNATCFNGQVDASGGILTTPVDAVSECAVKVDNNTYTCSIQKGKSDCTILGPIQIPSNAFIYETAGIQTVLLKETAEASIPLGQEGMYAMIDASSVYIPADTALDSPLYLTDTKQSRCDKEYLGCQIVGLEEQHTPDSGTASSYVYKKQTIFNLPSTYVGEQGTLCTQEQVACSAFTTSDGSTNYFKDPGVNANKLCVYQEPQQNDPNAPQGWFLKSVGQCSQNDKILCDSDATCGEGNTCDNIGESKPCYPNYQEDRDSYGLWSNGSDQYGGYVGECPATQNLCTELVDSYDIDTSGKNPNGKPYYVIYDERVTAPADECKDGASLREGCVLFDKTDVPTKSFDTNATYDASEARAKKGNINASVIPVSTSQNDANVLLKVGRNRECSEWLACKSFEPIQTADGKQTFACESFAPCTELSASGSCATWTADNEMRDPSDSYLNMKKFISRNTSWNGSEYTGYSLFDTFNLGDLQSINISINDVGITSSTVDTANAYIAYVIPNSYFDDNSTAVRCNSNGQGTGEMCGVDGEGRCIGKKCVIPADGSFDSKDIDLPKIAIALGEVECKVPPEVDSPFSFDIVSTEKRDAHSFAKDVVPVEPSEQTQLTRFTFSKRTSEANVCQGEDCTCNYVKISYGSSLVKDYWGVDTYHQNKSKLDVWGVCTGASETEGDYCDQDSDCVQGMCQKIDRIEAFVGSTGHCLEYDKSRPIFDTNGQKNYACLTWYPSDKSFGNIDTGNLYPEAGYYPSIDAKTGDKGIAGLVYCTDSFGRSGGAYEGSLTISPRYGGTSVGHGSIIDVSTVVLANLYNDIAPSSNYVRGGDPSHLETDGLPPYNQYELDDTTCTLPITEGNMFVENADVNNEIQLGFKTLYGRHYMQTYPVSCNFSGLDTQDFVGFGPADLDLNPYLWYVCGTKFANQDLSGETSSCSGDSVTSYTIGDALTSLYSFVSLFAWDHIDHNAVVLRVEGDSTSRLYNSEHLFGSVPIGTDTYMMSALLPYPYTIGHDSRTLVHPPRFENNGGQLTFKVEQENMTLDTRCHAAGGCPQEEETLEIRSSESEKYLNLAALESVYFLPLRTPGGTLMSTPAIVSRDLVINFGEELYTKTGIVAPESSGGYAEFSDKIRINNDVSVTSYKLQKDENSILPCNGLISFCDYSPNNYVFSSHFDASQSITFLGNSLSAALLPRNQIATRYVMTHYASSGHVPDFVNNSPDKKFVGATSLDTDPFTSDCGHNRGNFLAIGMDFNSDGEFLGYISRNCNGENEERAFGVQMAVVATMKEQCSEFISVYHDALLSDSTNKAWTNRVWKDSRFSLAVQAQTSQQFLRNTPRSPFGSTDLTHEDI